MVLPLAEPAALGIAKNRRGVNDGATSGGTFGQTSVIAKNRRGAADGAAASSTIDQASAIAKNRRGVTDGTTTGSTTVQASVIAKNRRGVADGATSGGTIGQASAIPKSPRREDKMSAQAEDCKVRSSDLASRPEVLLMMKPVVSSPARCQLGQGIAKSKAVIWRAQLRSS